MAKNDRYVVKNDKGWAVKKGGSPRPESVAGLFERVVQVAHEFGRPNVDRVLVFEGALLYTQNETELFDMVGQVG